MRRRKRQSSQTMFLLIVLALVGIGIAYAVLTEQLIINNTVSYDAMKWDIGFTSAEDGFNPYADAYIEELEKEEGMTLEEMGYTREEFISMYTKDLDIAFVTPAVTISSDKKTMTVNCELEMVSNHQMCIVSATISNNSTFNIAFSENPVITYDDTYVSWVYVGWSNDYIYDFDSAVTKGQTIGAGESVNVFFSLNTYELTKEMLPATELSIPVTIELDFEEVDYSIADLAMVVPHDYNTKIWSDTYKSKIKNITFENEITVPDNVVASWDMSLQKDGRVMSYVVPNESDSTYYDLYIQSDENLYANFDMSDWFYGFQNVDSINGLALLDTRFTENMNYMFYQTGYTSNVFTMNVSNFDTSNVTNMYMMFYQTGYNSNRLITSITIKNSNTIEYGSIFTGVATQSGSQITVNYTSETSDLVDQMIATKTENSNVVKGVQVD